MNEVTIDGVVYVKKETHDGLRYVIVRTNTAGVHAGYLDTRNGKIVTLKDTRRVWYWKGAASLSQLAGVGTSDPVGCKFPAAIDSITLTEAIEIIPCSDTARDLIINVKEWVA